ncbi:hypothetical protein pkur_cds_62 [Pandoravirus kuranda]|uniref:F-box domain containing protein n=1 Tax=Pandoravirus kuranda TaxID=3019033 RepID=A0AA95EDR1_9VIRU|nr:hypothetical protein pkur_cds_62 [Pandoravirus kuranda]
MSGKSDAGDVEAIRFDCLPDELVAAVLWAVGPSWRVAMRCVCRRWAALVSRPSRSQTLVLARCRPPLAEAASWEAGRVLCASALARAVARPATQTTSLFGPSSSATSLASAVSVAGIVAWCGRDFAVPVPRGDMVCAFMASAEPAAVRCALRLVDGAGPVALNRVACMGALAAACVDRAEVVELLLTWSANLKVDSSSFETDDGVDPLAWLDRVWLWTARHDAGRVATLLLRAMNEGHLKTNAVASRLAAAWFKGTWATAAGRAAAHAVLEAHASSGVPLGCIIGQRLAIAAAHVGNGRACAFGLAQAWLNTASKPKGAKRGDDDDDDDTKRDGANGIHTDAQGDRDMLVGGRVVTAAVVGRAPDAALDCLEALGLRGHPVALLEVAITHGHACGRGALALAMRWPRHATSSDGLAWTACAIGRAVSRGHLARADEVVAVLRPYIVDADAARRSRVDPWREVALDALVAGFTERAPLDTLALLCALAVRAGLGDREPLAVVLAGDTTQRRGTLCNASWATTAGDSAHAWSPWCRPVALDGRALSALLKRLPPAHAPVGSALVLWLDAAGLVSAAL